MTPVLGLYPLLVSKFFLERALRGFLFQTYIIELQTLREESLSQNRNKHVFLSTDSINVLPSSSAISEKVSSHIVDGELRSSPAEMAPVTSQSASAVTSSQVVVVMAASPTSSAVTPSLSSLLSTSPEAPVVGRLHQVNSVVVSSHFRPLMRSSVSEHALEESSIVSSSVEPTPADVSPTVSDITDASAAVTAPPTVKGKK